MHPPFKNKCIETLHLLLLVCSRPVKETTASKHTDPWFWKGQCSCEIRKSEGMNSFRLLHHQASGCHTDGAYTALLSTLWVFNQRKIQCCVYTNATMEQEVTDGCQQVPGPSSRLQMIGSFQVHFWSSLGNRSTTAPPYLPPPKSFDPVSTTISFKYRILCMEESRRESGDRVGHG